MLLHSQNDIDVVTEYNDDNDMEYDDSDGATVKDCKMIEVTLSGSHLCIIFYMLILNQCFYTTYLFSTIILVYKT